jgi:hypothetical protein
MAAGLGFKTFAVGEILSAANVNGYLMQGVLVFANATARDAAITSPQEGQFAYLKDTNVTTYYTGSAWANLDTTGMTNPMTTTGDMVYSSSGSTPARLGIGTAGQVLKVNSGATAPEWGAAAGGGFVGCRLTKSSVQSLDNATSTAITWNTEDFDTDGFHSTVSNTSRITIPVGKAGKYLITGLIGFTENSTGTRQVLLYKNGTYIYFAAQFKPADNTDPQLTFSTIQSLAESDYIELYAYQSSGGSLNYPKNDEVAKRADFAVQYLGA